LGLAAVDQNLVVVAAVKRGAVDLLPGQSLEDIVVKPLLEGGVLSCELDDLLGNNAAEEGRHGSDAGSRVEGCVPNHFFIEFI
jgi:hypothetical protein